jgi:hypothetical protein
VIYTVTVWLNTGPDNFSGYAGTHPLTTAADLRLRVDADSPQDAADQAFAVGNRQAADTDGRSWPGGVRSVSVGDLLVVEADGRGTTCLAVAPAGWTVVPEPANPRLPPAGQASRSGWPAAAPGSPSTTSRPWPCRSGRASRPGGQG